MSVSGHAREALAGHQQVPQRAQPERLGEQEALHRVATLAAQELELRHRLHAFRHHVQVQLMAERDDRGRHGAVVAGHGQVIDE